MLGPDLSGRFEPVSDSPFGKDQSWLARFRFQQPAKFGYVDIQSARMIRVLCVPDALEQPVTGHDAARAPDEFGHDPASAAYATLGSAASI